MLGKVLQFLCCIGNAPFQISCWRYHTIKPESSCLWVCFAEALNNFVLTVAFQYRPCGFSPASWTMNVDSQAFSTCCTGELKKLRTRTYLFSSETPASGFTYLRLLHRRSQVLNSCWTFPEAAARWLNTFEASLKHCLRTIHFPNSPQ